MRIKFLIFAFLINCTAFAQKNQPDLTEKLTAILKNCENGFKKIKGKEMKKDPAPGMLNKKYQSLIQLPNAVNYIVTDEFMAKYYLKDTLNADALLLRLKNAFNKVSIKDFSFSLIEESYLLKKGHLFFYSGTLNKNGTKEEWEIWLGSYYSTEELSVSLNIIKKGYSSRIQL